MARQLRIEYPGAFYHVTFRGNEKKEIFKSKFDREKFLSYRGLSRAIWLKNRFIPGFFGQKGESLPVPPLQRRMVKGDRQPLRPCGVCDNTGYQLSGAGGRGDSGTL